MCALVKGGGCPASCLLPACLSDQPTMQRTNLLLVVLVPARLLVPDHERHAPHQGRLSSTARQPAVVVFDTDEMVVSGGGGGVASFIPFHHVSCPSRALSPAR